MVFKNVGRVWNDMKRHSRHYFVNALHVHTYCSMKSEKKQFKLRRHTEQIGFLFLEVWTSFPIFIWVEFRHNLDWKTQKIQFPKDGSLRNVVRQSPSCGAWHFDWKRFYFWTRRVCNLYVHNSQLTHRASCSFGLKQFYGSSFTCFLFTYRSLPFIFLVSQTPKQR